MKVIYKTKTITEKVFVAIDGKEFLSEQACKEHEEYLNGTRKKCEKCNGTGRVNRRTEKRLTRCWSKWSMLNTVILARLAKVKAI